MTFVTGMLMANLVAQLLRAPGRRLYYYSSYDKGNAANRMEVDFLITKNDVTNLHNICPIEVKSGPRYTLSSIRKYKEKFSQYTSTAYVLHTGDLELRMTSSSFLCTWPFCCRRLRLGAS